MKIKLSGKTTESHKVNNIDSIGVSIIMPVYNSGKYLRHSLEGLIKQTYRNFELICVDDGSNDDSLSIINEYISIDNRIKVITKKHTNAGNSRNVGLQIARGKYVIFLDADDIFEKEMLKTVYEKAEEDEAEIVVFSGNNYCDDTGEIVSNQGLLRTNMVPQGVFNLNEYKGRILFTSTAPWNKLFQKKFILDNKLNFQSIQSANDLFFVTVALLVANKITVCDSCLIHYRVNNKNSLQGSSNKSPYDGTNALIEIYKELENREILERCQIDYNERAVSTILYLLKRIGDVSLYREFYDYLREIFIPEVNLNATAKGYFYNQGLYSELEAIINDNDYEYLFKKIKSLESKSLNKSWLFPFGDILPESEVMIYGAGNVGKAYLNQIKKTKYCCVKGIIDKREIIIEGEMTISPEVSDWKADYIVIAIDSKEIALDIKRMITDKGVDEDKIVWNILNMQ